MDKKHEIDCNQSVHARWKEKCANKWIGCMQRVPFLSSFPWWNYKWRGVGRSENVLMWNRKSEHFLLIQFPFLLESKEGGYCLDNKHDYFLSNSRSVVMYWCEIMYFDCLFSRQINCKWHKVYRGQARWHVSSLQWLRGWKIFMITLFQRCHPGKILLQVIPGIMYCRSV